MTSDSLVFANPPGCELYNLSIPARPRCWGGAGGGGPGGVCGLAGLGGLNGPLFFSFCLASRTRGPVTQALLLVNLRFRFRSRSR